MNKENKKIALISKDPKVIDAIEKAVGDTFEINAFTNGIIFYNQLSTSSDELCMILSDSSLLDVHGVALKNTIEKLGFGHLPFFMVVDKATPTDIINAISSGVTDFILKPINGKQLKTRLDFQMKHPSPKKKNLEYTALKESKTPFIKRLFDIVVCSFILLALLPLFLIVAILIKLESRGPVFYYSYRVGTGYNIFKFYKFRSMDPDADAKLQQLKHLNQYNDPEEEEEEKQSEVVNEVKELCEFCEQAGGGCLQPLYDDNKMVCEKILMAKKDSNKDAAFIKIKDDPRVTRIGKFIRNTSIDELPQLWNVLRGDMSLVGNRPLPLYEAEKITTDKYSLRFLGPAGITGLWQVEKRGRGAMSEEERLSLDNDYVKNFSIWFDIKILLRTIPALFQSENV
ncbi:sugar transferase [Cyclobacterium amurskyense]|uniref:Undecaprenyl-phosphate galactosephosphotransferase n=1 Tax=Cyclobacterium amurskyense TaxID=320787 RepID=A0A0H4PI47_9BACT|nr:sugar transferase [Cyclobacterium amurskyense]AKP54211.1 Undecaprenyl-phosphate galactosephosphotransferase [Cyclobacterium amurskyense]